ncbi:hypothetical protein E4U55_003754 [Claviceps digitariae]|nr:hypothetical protein E4U55_003754 [Claviceps digitariae]
MNLTFGDEMNTARRYAGTSSGLDKDQLSQLNPQTFQFTFNMPSMEKSLMSRDSSESLSDSVLNFPEEFGRTYHAYRAGSYAFPNDFPERERLELQGQILVELFGGRLYFAPLDKKKAPRHILDVATGLGEWAIQMGDLFPNSEIIATDLSPIQPDQVPPNVNFYVEDSSDQWDYSQKFDYIHTRVTGGCWCSYEEQVVQQAFEALEPGGYLESQEYDFLVGCDDGSMDPEGALAQWTRNMTLAGERCNRPTTTGLSLKESYKRVGFVDVQEVVFRIPTNGWPKDEHLKEIGRLWEMNMLSGLSGFSLSLFHRVFEKSAAETEARPANRYEVWLQKAISACTPSGSQAVVLMVMLSAVAFYLYNSQVAPLTGRRRFNFLSDKYVQYISASMSDKTAQQVRDKGKYFLSDRDPRTIIVKRVMRNLIRVSGLSDLNWEVRVIADDRQANALVSPDGKVFIYSGLLNLCRNEDALAAVLGHEIAHNTASHTAERMSTAWVLNLTTGSVCFLAGGRKGLLLFGLWNYTFGLYLSELLYYLPIGRNQETEADCLGLMMMAEACYDPREAVAFWRRVEALQRRVEKDKSDVLSTHPSSENRVVKMAEWMPLAMEKRAQSDCKTTSAFADRFRIALRRRVPLNEVRVG